MTEKPEDANVPRKISLYQVAGVMALFTMLLFAIVWSMMAWTSASEATMSVHGWIALGLGTTFSLVIGCGLMTLMFYSSRSGYDEVATPTFRKRDQPPSWPDDR